MRKWLRDFILLLAIGLLVTSLYVKESRAADSDRGYSMTFRIHGQGTVRLENSCGGGTVLESGEKTLVLPHGTYVKLTAKADTSDRPQTAGSERNSQIAIRVTDRSGIELEPASAETGGSYTREITVNRIDKVIDITFGNSISGSADRLFAAEVFSARASEEFPEIGDRFTGTCTVKSVIGGNGQTVHGVTLTGFTGILSGEKDAEADCAQHTAAAPREGMKYNYTYTIISVDKKTGKVTGNLYFVSQTQPATGEVDSDGYLTGYQALSGIFSIQREYAGKLFVKKTSAITSMTEKNSCYSLKGAYFGVYTASECNEEARTAVLITDQNGITDTAGLPAGVYYVKEISAPDGYALNRTVYTVRVNPGETASVNMKDYPQSAPIDLLLSKADSETGKAAPQGGATLEGAEFTVKYYTGYYKNDPSLQGIKAARTWVFKTGESGEVRLQEQYMISGDAFYKNSAGRNVIPLGTVTIEETKAPEGYLVNKEKAVCQISSEGHDESVETYNSPEIDESIIRGNLQLVKFSRNPDKDEDQKTPLEGIVFEITSVTTGEIIEITTDENGYASTGRNGQDRGGLMYDSYIVHEKNTPSGFEPVSDFHVEITEEGETLYYILENRNVVSPVKLVKKDSETGRVIPAAGARFELLNADKEIIKMTAYYPEKKVFEFFETDENGSFLLPERLPAGEYYFREIQAPDGYLLYKEDIRFTVEEGREWETPLVVEFPDENAMGRISLVKTDTQTGEPLAEAEFTVQAAEDIITPDGTVRIRKGEIADTLITDENGKADSKELFLGKYTVKERKQPAGYVREENEIFVELKYRDQKTEVVTEEVKADNRPSKFVLTKKESETEHCLPGVKFAFWKKDGNTTAGEKEYYTTGKDGTFTIERPVPGTYCIQEIGTIPGYLPDDTVYEFTVAGDGRIAGKDTGMMTVENKRTEITQTKAVNADTGGQDIEPGESKVIDTVSIRNLCKGTEYMLRGVLMDQTTGEILRENDEAAGTILMAQKVFTASDEEMEIEMEFLFDSAVYAGRTIVVFEYLYQEGKEISRHTDLEDLMQQIYVKSMEKDSPVKTEEKGGEIIPKTGDEGEILPFICLAAAVVPVIFILRKKKQK